MKVSQITSNTLTITPEDANINLTSTKAFNKIKDTYYCQYGQSISLTSNNSNLNFPSSITYQWQYSENGTSNWQDISANGTSSSLPIDIEGNIYYRLVVGETAMGDANIYSNVIHFDSSMPTATINFASSNNSNSEVTTSFNQPFNFAAIFKQNNNTINSNSNIQIMWQYKINNGKWINTSTNPLLLTPNNVLYQYICNQTGIVNIRLEYTYNTIIQYSNILTLYNIDPTIQPDNNVNISNLNNTLNSNNFITNNNSTYIYNYGSDAVLSLYNPAFNLKSINQDYSIQQIQWFKKGNSTALATYTSYDTNQIVSDYAVCVTSDESYYAIVTYSNSNSGATYTATTPQITLNSINSSNQYVANVTLNNVTELNSGLNNAIVNKYYFMNSDDLMYMQDSETGGSWQYILPSFNLNLYYDGQELNNNSSTIKNSNWEVH